MFTRSFHLCIDYRLTFGITFHSPKGWAPNLLAPLHTAMPVLAPGDRLHAFFGAGGTTQRARHKTRARGLYTGPIAHVGGSWGCGSEFVS